MKIFVFALIILSFLSCQNREMQVMEQNDFYTEQHRPQFHFSPEANWMNDPNGMYYQDGEYHLFYQYFPDSNVWGSMHWGHAISEDLVHWDHLPIALYPDSLGLIFSGSVVVDHNNTSGFGKDGVAPVIAIFTHHDMEGEKAGTNTYQYQSIAYSLDNGRTFTKYEGNPVVPNPGIRDFRDPKVIWDEKNKQWVMVFAAYDKALFYISPNLKDWTQTGAFGIEGDTRLWECPDLFPLKVEGTEEVKWVLITSIQKEAPNGGTATSYFIGDWNGKSFVGDSDKQKWLDYGTDNYAFVTWSDIPKSDGRRIGMGWMSNWQYATVVPTYKWRSAMTLPRVLKLAKDQEDLVLISVPVAELDGLEKKGPNAIDGARYNKNAILSVGKELLKLDFRFEKPTYGNIQLRFSNSKGEFIDFGYETKTNQYFIDRSNSGKKDFNEVFAAKHFGQGAGGYELVHMIVYLDQSSIELFADDGKCVMTDIYFPNEDFNKLELITQEEIHLISGKIVELKSIWID